MIIPALLALSILPSGFSLGGGYGTDWGQNLEQENYAWAGAEASWLLSGHLGFNLDYSSRLESDPRQQLRAGLKLTF